MTKARFPNLRSRLLVKPMFDRQFVVPEPPPRWLAGLLRLYETLVLRPQVDRISIDRPIFLISLPRSGSTMLQDILCTHPLVAYVTNAMHLFRESLCAAEILRKRWKLDARGERYLGDSVEVEAGSPSDAVVFWAELLQWDAHDLGCGGRQVSDYSEEQVESIRTAVRRVLWCFEKENPRFFAKNPGLLTEILLLKDIFPNARFVHLVRDGRMCANSMCKLYRLEQQQLAKLGSRRRRGTGGLQPFVPYPRMPKLRQYVEQFGPDDIRTTAHLWADAVDYVYQNKDRLPSFHEVRYEDVLRNPKDEIDRILAFCELEPIRDDNAAFRAKLSQIGHTHHANRYADFDVVTEICRGQLQRYAYLTPQAPSEIAGGCSFSES